MSIEAMKMALEAMEFNGNIWHIDCKKDDAIAALRQAIGQAEKQEPVVGTKTWFEDGKVITHNLYPSALYTAPPKREWVGLTNEEIDSCDEESGLPQWEITTGDLRAFAKVIEAKLKEKNA